MLKELKSLKLNVPMRDRPNCDFSYAGKIIFSHENKFIKL